MAKRAACQAWSRRNAASGSSLSGGRSSGSGGPNGSLVATSWARTRAVRTGSLSPSRASASTQSSCTRPATRAAVPDADDGGRVGQRGDVVAAAGLVGRLLARGERVGDGAAAVEVARPLDELARPGHGPSVGVSGRS